MMIYRNLITVQSNPVYQTGGVIRKVLTLLFLLLPLVSALPFPGYPAEPTYPISADVQTTRQRTVSPDKIPDAPEITIGEVDQYHASGYSNWSFGGPVDYGKLLPDGSPVGSYNAVETLLTYFSISDIHITDKESPA
jgi:hypothetical protein